jgi:hypothetical protein
MNNNRISMPWLLGLVLALITPLSQAENSKDFGEYVVHYNSLSTDMLSPQVAREYRITRSKNRGMINITVLRKVLGSPGQPVHAMTQVSAMNLTGQGRKIRMREVREGNAIYYIGEFRVTNEETLKFDVHVRPQGTREYLQVEFSQAFYTQ